MLILQNCHAGAVVSIELERALQRTCRQVAESLPVEIGTAYAHL